MFNVGNGVLAKMTELGDSAIHDSMFTNIGKIQVEWGFGVKYDYHATNASGSWVVNAQPTAVAPQPAVSVTDMRGKLPKRAGAVAYRNRPLAPISLYTIHYTVGPTTQTVQQVAAYQVGPTSQLPFPAIAYHLFVEGSGKVNWCHDFSARTWGSDGAYQGQSVNDIAVHACYAGDSKPNAAQIAGLKTGLAFAISQLGRSLLVRGHKDDDATQCPGQFWQDWRGQIVA